MSKNEDKKLTSVYINKDILEEFKISSFDQFENPYYS